MVELGAQELEEEAEGLQETLAEDLDGHQESVGSKRDAEEIHVGTPTKKRKYAKDLLHRPVELDLLLHKNTASLCESVIPRSTSMYSGTYLHLLFLAEN